LEDGVEPYSSTFYRNWELILCQCSDYVILNNWGFFLFSDIILEFMLKFSLIVKMKWLCFKLISTALFLIKLKYFWNDENVWHPVCLNINCIFNLENISLRYSVTWTTSIKLAYCRPKVGLKPTVFIVDQAKTL